MDTENKNMTPTNTNPQPDYGFLDNYAAPPPQKSHGRKKIILAFAGLVLIALIGVAVLSGMSSEQSTQPATTNTTGQIANSTNSRFVEKVLAEQYAEAYDMLDEGMKDRYSSQAVFEKSFAPSMNKMLTTYDCKTTQIDRTKDQNSLIYRCEMDSVQVWTGLGILNMGQQSEQVYKLCPISAEELTACS